MTARHRHARTASPARDADGGDPPVIVLLLLGLAALYAAPTRPTQRAGGERCPNTETAPPQLLRTTPDLESWLPEYF
uniref:Secreted protein n=1 Tax=Streptomyces sp. NBC_00003 TaxID=2903608 RepID=A0AAU2V6X3_9ACTN